MGKNHRTVISILVADMVKECWLMHQLTVVDATNTCCAHVFPLILIESPFTVILQQGFIKLIVLPVHHCAFDGVDSTDCSSQRSKRESA